MPIVNERQGKTKQREGDKARWHKEVRQTDANCCAGYGQNKPAATLAAGSKVG